LRRHWNVLDAQVNELVVAMLVEQLDDIGDRGRAVVVGVMHMCVSRSTLSLRRRPGPNLRVF
jgi:hypothetical protein